MKSLLKKIFIICGVIGIMSATVGFLNTQQTFADSNGFVGSCRSFLGFNSWDCNVNISNQESLKSGIWTIAANVAIDITVAAAYLIVGYVIYGGYLYTFSQGDPSKVATGKKALTHAFIGLAIVMSANIILNTIRIALGKDFTTQACIDGSLTTNCYGLDSESNSAVSMISGMLQWVIGVAGLVSVVFIVYGGISYITSTGDPGKIKKAKDMILYALIGLAIVALSEIIVAFVSGVINDANKNAGTSTEETPTSYINQTIDLKELYET